jgi:DNA polymerase elongation subunit (family B)
MEVPLSVIVNRRNGTIPTLYLLNEMIKNKMIPFSTNTYMYENLIKRAEQDFGETKFFQGAYVDVLQTGKFKVPLYKSDFTSLYPNIIRTFNLSYETTSATFEYLKEEEFCKENKEEESDEIIVPSISDELGSYSFNDKFTG